MPTGVLDAASVGVLAGEVLSRPGPAAILASFERSFCLDVGGELITIGDDSLHDGPLNLRLTGHQGAGFTIDYGIEVGQRWTVSPDRLCRTDGLAIDLTSAVAWRPRLPTERPDHAKLTDGLACLHNLLETLDPKDDGLLRLTLEPGSPRNATERAAEPHIDALRTDLPHWLLDDVVPDRAPVVQLLGIGPGLTPSGDDLLAGILIAWHHIGMGLAAGRLERIVLDAAVERTTPISQAHLAAAAKGYGAAPLHDLLQAVLANKPPDIEQALDAAAKIGHSSGLDAIAGMMLALTAWLEVKHEVPITA